MIKGTTIISIKKSIGSLHANDDTIITEATNMTANPVDAATVASKLRYIRDSIDDSEKSRIIMPPIMTTAI